MRKNMVFFLLFLPILTISAIRLPDSEEVFETFDEGIRVPYEEARKSMGYFRSVGLMDFQPITVDSKEKQLIIGSREIVTILCGQSRWTEAAYLCAAHTHTPPPARGESDVDQPPPPNKLKPKIMLQIIPEVSSAVEQVRDGKAFSLVEEETKPTNDLNGIGAAPYSPEYNSTYLMTNDGELYSGIVTDFAGHDSSFLRILPSNRLLRTAKSNNRWLNEPSFVGSFESGNFLYFFFREPAVETTACATRTLSRVGRICKNDVGGDVILKDYWTTFSKSTLNCSANGVRYDWLKSIYFDENKDVVYAAFSKSERSEIASSAVCVYSIASFRQAFGGPYLYKKGSSPHWTKHPNGHPYFDCEVKGVTSVRPGLTRRPLVDAQRYQIMASHVQPVGGASLHFAHLEEYTHLVVDSVRVKHYGIVKVVFALTKNGLMKKFVVLPDEVHNNSNNGRTCLVEVVQIWNSNSQFRPTDVKLYPEMGAIYVGTKEKLVKVPVERCKRFLNRQQCVDSEDPYCGWNSKVQKCTVAPGGSTVHHFWHQKLDGCPKTNFPVDGKFGGWSDWFVCPQDEMRGENCQCRNRFCDTPKPRLGGKTCEGPKVQVTNCTRHGAFTKWSDWSACSSSCGVSVRTRTRDCSNPAPAFGGRVCIGPTSQQEYCKQTACPIPTPPPVHGGWSPWAPWGRCTRKCGGGFQRRVRMCNNPTPTNDGNICGGCDTEYKACNTEACEEVRRWSNWTPWLQGNVTGASDGIWVQRFKFACRARIDDPKLVTVSRPRSQKKFCRKDGQDCTDTAFAAIDGSWSQWTHWSECSRPCENGTQSRIRTCTDPAPAGSGLDCPGHAKEQRQCNNHGCYAEWTCWSEYSACSVSCGSGVKHRVRKCDRIHGMKSCEGRRVETAGCEMGPCTEDGYGVWSGWSACSELWVKVRIRPCISKSYCSGIPDAQMKKCQSTKTNALEYTSETGSGNLALIFGVVGAFLAGIVVTLGLTCFAVRRQSNCCYVFGMKKPHNPPSTHPPTPIPLKSNIYTPPPTRNIHSVNGSLTINPLTTLLGPEKVAEFVEMDDLSEQEANLTLRRTMRASLNTRDYL